MEKNNILNADVLDIIFDGRNKQYGAYQLRKTYNTRLKIALGVMGAVCLLAVGGSVLAGNGDPAKKTQMLVHDVSLANIPEPPREQPVIPPAPKEEPKIEIKQFTAPKLVTTEVKDPPPAQDALDDTKIGPINQQGIKSDVVAPPVEDKGTGTVVAPVVDEDYTKEFKTVQIQASFPGGPEAWQKYLQSHLRAEVASENGAPSGKYPVVVSFLVDKDGNISEVRAENNPGYGTAAEAERVIKQGPKWNPAIQNGRKVIYRQKQTVIFSIADGE